MPLPLTVLSPSLTDRDAQMIFGAVLNRTSMTLVESSKHRQTLLDRVTQTHPSDIVLATSGSRSERPHLVALSWEALLASAAATMNYLGQDGQWILTLPLHHIAGLQVVVRSTLSGNQPLVVQSENGFRPAEFAKTLSLAPDVPLYTSLVPTQLHRLLNAQVDLSRLQTILVGGARLDPQLRRLADQQGLNLVTTYGMSETSGGCVYNGTPLPGTKIRTVNQQIQISGDTLMDGYLDEPNPFVVEGDTTWMTTNDLGQWDGHVLAVHGRMDDVIISGGENVSAIAVQDAILAEFPEVSAVEVIGYPDPQWGQIVCAIIVGQVQGDEIRARTVARLGPKSSPRLVVNLSEFPLLSSGKPDRAEITRLVASAITLGEAWRR